MFKKLFYLKLMCLVLFSTQINAQCTNDNGLNEYPDVAPTVNGNGYDFSAIGGSTVVNGTTFNTAYLEYEVSGSQNLTGTRQRINLPSIPAIDNKARQFTVNYSTMSGGETWGCYLTIFYNYVDGGTKYVALSSKVVNLTPQNSSFIIPAGVNKFFIQLHKKTDCTGGIGFSKRVILLSYNGLAISSNKIITNVTGCPTAAAANGKIELAPSDGTAPYTYNWSSSVAGFTAPTANSSSINNLAIGEYSCTITDSSSPAKTISETYSIGNSYTVFDTFIKTDATCGTYGLTLYPMATKLVDRNFTQPTGFSVSGAAGWDSSLGDTFLVPDQTSKQGKLIINDMPATLPSDFEVNYEFKMLNKSGADGYSFNLGNDSFAGAYEDGVNQGLAIKFKTYNQDQISVAWNGTQIVAPINFTVEKGYWMAVKVRVIGGKLTLYVDGSKIIDNVTITGYTQNNTYKMILAGRTGGVSNEIRIDNVSFANPTFVSYSIDGVNFQTSATFSNITLPTNRTLPIWLQQDGCAVKVRDFVYPDVITNGINVMNNLENNSISIKTEGCDPTGVRVGGGTSDNQTNFFVVGKAYTNDFTTNDGYTYGGAAYKNNGIALTRNAIDNKGYLIVNKPESIDRDFEIGVSHKALNQAGADGFSINFGDVTPIINETVAYENGVSTGLAVRFKTFGQDNVSVFYNGVQVGSTVNTTIEDGNINTINVKVLSGLVTVSINGSPLISQTLPVSYTTDSFTNHQFIVAARTGGAFNENLIKSIIIFNNATLQASTDNITFTDLPTNVITTIPLAPANIVNDKTNVYLKYKEGCATTRIVKDIVAYNTHAATPTGSSNQNYTPGVTKFQDLDIITVPGFELRWFTNLSYADNPGPNLSYGYYPNTLIPNGTTVVYAVATKTGATSTDYGCPSFKKSVMLTDLLSNQSFEKLGAKMYPNPTTGSLILQLEDYNNTTVKIIDLNGRTIQNHTLNSTQSTFDVSHLSNGIYFLQINTGKGNATQKFIKQ